MKTQLKILLLEDAPLDAELIKRELVKGGVSHELLVVGNRSEFVQALKNYPADIILSDHSLPGFSSHEALKLIQQEDIAVPFILVTATMTDEFAVNIMKEGANDYIIKDRLSRLPSAVNNALEKFRLMQEQILERVKVSNELKQLNYRLQLATKSANLGIWDWNIVKNKMDWDEGMCMLYNLPNSKFDSAYEAWILKIHPLDRERVAEEMQLALDGTKKYDTEFRIMYTSELVHTLRATGIVERNSKGVPVRMIGINWDITKRKWDTLEREKIIEEMLRRNAELEQFSYIISHNLRAPVANIIGASIALGDVELADEDRAVYTQAVQKSALNLDTIIKDLNHILEVKGGNYTKEVVVFSNLVNNVKLLLKNILLGVDYEIICNFTAMEEIYTVKPYLDSIFYNLISNSIKYRSKNIPGIIHIESHQLDNKTVLIFTDNGIGLNLKKNKDQIFGLYKRFHFDLPGKGMGLFMVKSQVEILGGSISIESSENKGTKFTIELE
jgi:signal transduction histidine kinase/CheY-like chemotaxis protein